MLSVVFTQPLRIAAIDANRSERRLRALFYQMLSRSISHEQKIRPVTNGLLRTLNCLPSCRGAALRTGLSLQLQNFRWANSHNADKPIIRLINQCRHEWPRATVGPQCAKRQFGALSNANIVAHKKGQVCATSRRETQPMTML
jgi:hypothetical protein